MTLLTNIYLLELGLKMNYKANRSKATDISPSVKKSVWERDSGKCIICKDIHAFPEAHYIPRSSGGLGIEENIVSLCRRCHYEYDQTCERGMYRKRIKAYLQRKYPNWDETKLYYKK